MLIFFKPQFGGFDGGGIAGGYVIPTDRKKQLKKKSAPRKAQPTSKPTPQAVVELAKDDRVEELHSRLNALSAEVEIEVLKGAEAMLLAQLEQAALRQEQDAKEAEQRERERYALELFSQMIEQAQRELAAEEAEVIEILDILDGDALRALEVHSYTSRKKLKRPFSKR